MAHTDIQMCRDGTALMPLRNKPLLGTFIAKLDTWITLNPKPCKTRTCIKVIPYVYWVKNMYCLCENKTIVHVKTDVHVKF